MSKHEAECFELEEVLAIIDAAGTAPIKWKAIVNLLIATGARRGEIMVLQWKSVDFKANRLYLCNTFPMLIFSGATLPYEVMPDFMQKAVNIMPLTQGIKILKNVVLGLPIENVTGPIIAMLAVAAICAMIAIRKFRWE